MYKENDRSIFSVTRDLSPGLQKGTLIPQAQML
jgi:hypothetical protein